MDLLDFLLALRSLGSNRIPRAKLQRFLTQAKDSPSLEDAIIAGEHYGVLAVRGMYLDFSISPEDAERWLGDKLTPGVRELAERFRAAG